MATQVTLALPQGKEVQVQVPPNCHLHFLFSMEEVMFERNDSNLVISAEDGGRIILEGFFGFAHIEEMPLFILPGDIFVEAKDLLPLIDNTFESFRPNGAPCLLEFATQPEAQLPGTMPSHNMAKSDAPVLRFQDVLEDDKANQTLFPETSAALPPDGPTKAFMQQEPPVNMGTHPAGEQPQGGAQHTVQPTQGCPVAQAVGAEEEALHALLQYHSIVG